MEFVLELHMVNMRVMMDEGEDLEQMEIQSGRTAQLPVVFFSRFRSERLELLLLRYLTEDGVNVGVAREVHRASDELGFAINDGRTDRHWGDSTGGREYNKLNMGPFDQVYPL